jgi:hypothetical protein
VILPRRGTSREDPHCQAGTRVEPW